jgi:hypothetical protein
LIHDVVSKGEMLKLKTDVSCWTLTFSGSCNFSKFGRSDTAQSGFVRWRL